MAPTSVLAITTTKGYRHDSIPTAIEILKKHAGDDFTFTFTEEPDKYLNHLENLLDFDALCFLHTTGDILNETSLTNLPAFTRRPEKAVIGIHSGGLVCPEHKNFTAIFGTTFDYHPDLQKALVYKTTQAHPSTTQFPSKIEIEDEWYNYTSDPTKTGVTVLLGVDDNSYTDTGKRLVLNPHPVCWCREAGERSDTESNGPQCRVWYTSLGHTHEIWRENETFITHIMDGMKWAAKRL